MSSTPIDTLFLYPPESPLEPGAPILMSEQASSPRSLISY
jgi:hypothetical protein